jgi:2'-5' RNA ligase
MRLFIAVNFDDNTKSKITEIAGRLKAMGISGNYTKVQNYHLTLLFLGESNERQLQFAKKAIQEIRIPPFDISFQNISNFSKNIVHLKVSYCEQLTQIHNFLYDKLKSYFTLDDKFSPHITLIRKPDFIPNIKSDEFGDILPFVYRVDNIALMLSSRQNGELVYAPLFVHKL